jgi:hypothetical protein
MDTLKVGDRFFMVTGGYEDTPLQVSERVVKGISPNYLGKYGLYYETGQGAVGHERCFASKREALECLVERLERKFKKAQEQLVDARHDLIKCQVLSQG